MKKILIVEDETIMRDSLRDWLADIGYEVETTGEGESALKNIAEQDYGLVILDLRLPGKDGLEVLREAKGKKPQLKGIIITAYPSVQTAVTALKEGAVDYMSKPVNLNELEKLIEKTLGPVQVEIRKRQAITAEPTVIEETRKAAEPTIAPEAVPVHIKQGKTLFESGQYAEALKEFTAVLRVAPGNIESRVWSRKTREAMLAPPDVAGQAGTATAVKPKECLWMKMGIIPYRICTRNYECVTCEFDQSMQEKMASGESTELDAALEKFKQLPGNQRLCRYALKGDVSHRVCTRLFHCSVCEFSQMMEDALQQKLAKLAVRREALLKKEQKTVATATAPKA